jgi:cytidyltransferase-like protein
MRVKKIFVSGCFDMLHSGHVRFLEEAASFGEVHVGLGSDRTFVELKGRVPVNSQAERKYMLEALRYVRSCQINSGTGILDFRAMHLTLVVLCSTRCPKLVPNELPA